MRMYDVFTTLNYNSIIKISEEKEKYLKTLHGI